MTGEDFTAWMQHMGYNITQTVQALEVSRNTVPRYMKDGAPLYIALACAALARKIQPWRAGRA